MNHRQRKKNYTKRYGIRPIIFLDKKRKDKAMSLIRAWMNSKGIVYIPDDEHYKTVVEYYENSTISQKRLILAWERKWKNV